MCQLSLPARNPRPRLASRDLRGSAVLAGAVGAALRRHPADVRRRGADRLVGMTDAEAAERVPDICGLEVRTHTDLGPAHLSAHRSRRPVVHFPLPGRITAGYRGGAERSPEDPRGVTQFDDDRARS